jgi:hypothetical protein
MCTSFGCRCEERRKPVGERNWGVIMRCYHRSAFAGGHWTPSDYSTVVCLTCGAIGRTKAQYVEKLRDARYVNGKTKLL